MAPASWQLKQRTAYYPSATKCNFLQAAFDKPLMTHYGHRWNWWQRRRDGASMCVQRGRSTDGRAWTHGPYAVGRHVSENTRGHFGRMGLDAARRARPPPQGASSRRRTFGSSDASGTSEHLTCAFTSPRCDCTRSTGTLDALPLPELLKWPLDHSSGPPASLQSIHRRLSSRHRIALYSPHLPLWCLYCRCPATHWVLPVGP